MPHGTAHEVAVRPEAAIVAALTLGLSLFDAVGREAYAAFMATAAISVCACVLIAAVVSLRLRRVA